MSSSTVGYTAWTVVLALRIMQVALGLGAVIIVTGALIGGMNVLATITLALLALVAFAVVAGLEGVVRLVRGRFGQDADPDA